MVDHFCVRKEVSPRVGERGGRGLSLTVTPGDAVVSQKGTEKGVSVPPQPPPRLVLDLEAGLRPWCGGLDSINWLLRR